ncbi:YdcF family protein [Polycladomyces subterraneus]|uniref:YdcF family protein n=1 Tax=Polycladomyces subterraneus TaxID=1016997 RepID=A0ABT8IML3_9BACL|nr:YdcF family protein [Polycladomyces subterraneus]MDN4594015.1 YdcF family protein [Polycladomyces subterraneus]
MPLKIAGLLGMVLFVITGLSVLIYWWPSVSRYDTSPMPEGQKQAALVLGAALWDDRPSPALMERLEMAVKLFEQKKVQYIVLSGGPEGNGVTEAQAMKDYLISHGVPAASLILEDRSRNTEENLRFCKRILDEHHWDEVYLVTHDYHQYRALQYAARAGIRAVPAPVHSQMLWTPYHKARECLALVKLALFSR